MPLPICALPGQAAGQTDLDIAFLIGGDPGRALDLALAQHGAGLHRGVDLVAGAVQEAGVDEHDPVAHGMDAAARLALVRRSSSITPILIVWRGRDSRSSMASNRSLAKAASSGPCILGLTM
jgi:hypothetical protein